MKLTNRDASSEWRGVRLTKVGGWIALVTGAVHVVVAALESRSRDVWSQVVDEGWWNTFTLDESTTLAQFERSETFWVTLGSCGVPLLVFGSYVCGRRGNASACRGGSAGSSSPGRCSS